MSITPCLLTGILVADQWDDYGNITHFALLTNDEGKYCLHFSSDSDQALPMLRQIITVNGYREDENDNQGKLFVIDLYLGEAEPLATLP